MSRPGMLGLVRHEARALWPVWAASVAACLAAGLSGQLQFVLPGRLAYFAGSVALAALAIGHEYMHGTLPALLSLPVDRGRLFIAKLLAVLPMLLVLAPLALFMGTGGPYFERGTTIGGLSVLAAIALAPWLTMICRSPLAGSVFALGLTGALHIVAMGLVILYVELNGPPSLPLQAFLDRILVALLIGGSVLAAFASWRTFLTLEAADGRGADVSWPRWLRSAMVLDEARLIKAPQQSSPLWLLAKKELRLQQMSIAVAAINVMIWLAAYAVVGESSRSDGVLSAVAVLYGALVAMLIGALASAEERHLGTLAWQTLLPVAAWRQFAVKTAVALVLSLLLAWVLPVLLARGELPFRWFHAALVVLLTIGSLFISSLSSSGLKALSISAPAFLALAALLGWSFGFAQAGPGAVMAVAGGLAALAWWFAFVNHRTVRS